MMKLSMMSKSINIYEIFERIERIERTRYGRIIVIIMKEFVL